MAILNFIISFIYISLFRPTYYWTCGHGVACTCLVLIEFLNTIVIHLLARLLMDLVKNQTTFQQISLLFLCLKRQKGDDTIIRIPVVYRYGCS